MTRVRDIANILGVTEAANPTNAVLTSTADGSGGVTVYATKEDLPSSGLTSGDQAYVTANSRFYISNGSGWYNVALINATPSLTIDPTGAIELSTEGATTTITLTATDSDNAVAGLTYSVESDGSFAGLGTISQDSSVFTITPLSEDSATTVESTLTFKASDGISFGSGTRTFTLTFITVIENSAETTLLLKADTTGTDNQVDASTNNYTITENGNVTSTTFSPYHPGGYSTYFDGASAVENTIDAIGNGDFTFEGWLNITADTAGNYQMVFDNRSTLSTGPMLFYYEVDGKLYPYLDGTAFTSNNAISQNTWYHWALVRNNNACTFYLNGTAQTSNAGTSITTNFTGTEFNIGRSSSVGSPANGDYFIGYQQDFRVVKGTAVYTSNFTPPTERLTAITNTQLLTAHLPYLADGSSNNHTITIAGNTSTKRFNPYDYIDPYTKADHGGSIYFDGSGDNFTIPTGLNLGSSDFTVEFWIWPDEDFTNSAKSFMNMESSGTGLGWSLRNETYQNYNGLTFAYGLWGGYTTGKYIDNYWIPRGVWTHIVGQRRNGTIEIYVNGVSQTLSLYEENTTFDDGKELSGSQTSRTFFNGVRAYVSDFRLVSGSFVYNGNFTPPTAPLTAITNTLFLTCTNKNNIWDASSGSLLTKVANITASAAQAKFATSDAVYFDGTDDYISVDADVGNFGTGDFTIEMWIYPTEYSNGLFNKTTSTGSSSPPSISVYMTSSALLIGVNSGSASGTWNTCSSTASLNQWSHFAITRQGTSLKAFLNGTSILSATNSANVDNNITFNLGKWRNTDEHYNGYMQDVRLTKGLARYTSNFTPPTAEFEG